MAPCVSTGRELSFEWSHHTISSASSLVRVTLQNSIKHFGSERDNLVWNQYLSVLIKSCSGNIQTRPFWQYFHIVFDSCSEQF